MTTFMKTTVLVCIAALFCVPTAHAGFMLIDDFSHADFVVGQTVDGRNGWTVHRNASRAAVVADPTDPTNQVLRVRGASSGSWPNTMTMVTKDLGDILTTSDTGTLFLRVLSNDGSTFGEFGFARSGSAITSGGSSNYNAFSGSLQVNGSSAAPVPVRVHDGSDFDTTSQINLMTWYNFWIVADNATKTFKAYMTTGANGATEANRLFYLDGNNNPVDTFSFRDPGSGSINRVLFGGHIGTRDVFYDDIYFAAGQNLSFIPEPGSLALLGLGGVMMCLRRRSAA